MIMVLMVLLTGTGVRYGRQYLWQAPGRLASDAAGVAAPQFSSEEADLMTTVFKSALRFLSGSASRDELASELSDKLYAGRGDAGTMSELGIELVKPGSNPSPLGENAAVPNGRAISLLATSKQGARWPNKPAGGAGQPGAQGSASQRQEALLARSWTQVQRYRVELIAAPVVLLGLIVGPRLRRRARGDELLLSALPMQEPAEIEAYEMTHGVHALTAEDFELLVALIYQRQGYRVSMPAGLGGGRGGSFMLLRKAERLLVQCKRMSPEIKVPVERVSELYDAVLAAGATRGLYVASCGFSWDARNFARRNGVTAINARTLDELITAAREAPDEDLLAVSKWAPKFMTRVELKPPLCPACEAPMAQLEVSDGAVWVCSQRPECRGRRSPRAYRQATPNLAPAAA